MKKVLIAIDCEKCLRSLKSILDKEYDVVLARDGNEALSVLLKYGVGIEGVILGLNLPKKNGYEVLQYMQHDITLKDIPVIIASDKNNVENEQKALEAGAWDFITKPYEADIIRSRFGHAIERSKLNTFKEVKHQAEHDILTNLYNGRRFEQAVSNLIKNHKNEQFVLVRIDVNRFKQFNTLHGKEQGDSFIKYIGQQLPYFKENSSQCIYGRVDGDVFAVCMDYQTNEQVLLRVKELQKRIKEYTNQLEIVSRCGIYYIKDTSVTVTNMLNCAAFASERNKDNYSDTIEVYNEQIGFEQQQELEITTQMAKALEEKQFLVYYQPKYNINKDTIIGSEALVRWLHPTRGLISPGVFIPIFEKTGFIGKVDYYVWERTCQDLRDWIDRGIQPKPVSVNISRVNLSNPNIVQIICNLVSKYHLDPNLLELEITETAYMDNPKQMNRVVEELHQEGFKVLMDDFGSGYSSLNMLKDIEVDAIKIDMFFLSKQEDEKSMKILIAVVRLAELIGIPSIVEGVETYEQKSFVKSIGCQYVQGFYYGRPMPKNQFEERLKKQKFGYQDSSIHSDTTKQINYLDPTVLSVLNHISLPIGIYLKTKKHYERIVENKCYFETFGHSGDIAKLRASKQEKEKFSAGIEEAIISRGLVKKEVSAVEINGNIHCYDVSFSYLSSKGEGSTVVVVFKDVTEEKARIKEIKKIHKLSKQMAQQKTLLIIDDSIELISMIEPLFLSEFTLLQSSTKDGIKLLKQYHEDIACILLRNTSGEGRGQVFLNQKNSDDSFVAIPVIVFSNDVRQASQTRLLKQNVNDYITKPYVPEVVYRRIHNVIDSTQTVKTNLYHFNRNSDRSSIADLNQEEATIHEIYHLVNAIKPLFDVVRVVDPTNTSILTLDEENNVHEIPYSCFQVWNKNTRCKNCTSMKALECHSQLSKYEFIENEIFYVISKPITMIYPSNERRKVVLEIVSHISDSIMMKSVNGMDLQQLVEETRKKIYCDPLTDAFNRRYLFEMLFLSNQRNDVAKDIALIMMDMNHFKEINDECGHDTGDYVLKEVTKRIKENVRLQDSFIRYGGDEFILILADCKEDVIASKIEKLQQILATVIYDKNKHVSAKFGYSYRQSHNLTKEDVQQMITEADQRMYQYGKEKSH